MTIELPHRFGRYTLVEKLAQGGMAEIYRARYEGEGGFVKPVAIKRILPTWSDDPEFVRLLIDEAHALAYLQHQNIVQVYELGKDGAAYFIAMEFVPGVDCRTLLRRLRERQAVLHDGFALFLLAEVLKGLAFAHAQTGARGEAMRFVHRDISPQNILLSFHGEVKIADFGIAKGMHRHEQTAIAQLKGKYAYMAPEQAMAMPVDARADIFSAGVVGYELLTGQPCFDGPSDLAVLERVKQAGLVPGWERQFPPVLRAVLRRALARDPEERYSTAQVFLDEILRYITTQRLFIHGFE
ncbi:MAG: serine/threonine protein kinase, partial [Deltaproteobacteria bacterium]|nr:serine/threonine protein kinase [Deltaproteobacteria bacterium]